MDGLFGTRDGWMDRMKANGIDFGWSLLWDSLC